MLAWIKWIVAEQKAIASLVVLLLGISGVSLYGNVNEFNPWKPVAEESVVKEKVIPNAPVKIIEKTIETRVESGITQKDIASAMAAHIKEFH